MYWLACRGQRIYCGSARDVDARFLQHRSGQGARFTRSFPPERVLLAIPCGSRGDALRLEARLKTWTRARKLALLASLTTPAGPAGYPVIPPSAAIASDCGAVHTSRQA